MKCKVHAKKVRHDDTVEWERGGGWRVKKRLRVLSCSSLLGQRDGENLRVGRRLVEERLVDRVDVGCHVARLAACRSGKAK